MTLRGLALAMLAMPAAAASTADPSAPPQDSPRDQPPKLAVVPGFEVELVATAPDVLWPSAVHCLPDGTLLIAEDRMDMPGPTDQPIDTLHALEWKPDGGFVKKVFAGELFAIMGIADVDDAVYVVNMPRLTVLRDHDGDHVADERRELLTDLGPPAPGWPGGFNDHIVSGLRLGVDGWLYLSVGDKGIPAARGTDGSTLTLRGGGVIRMRPDGSRLELVSSGTRNHLDVAIDERGEMFTYDNTDDGLGWWTRVTHHVLGGYYGYPWDYREHPERALPCMRDFGGGSPCGGLVYREGLWPEPFGSSAYWCEWGKGAVRRIEFARAGSSFELVHDEDFVAAGTVADFRPIDLCESRDGRFLYVADWAFTGWTAPNEAGRLWRVRRATDREPIAGPHALPTSIAELVQVLDGPSFSRRLRAQRELVRLGASDALLELLGGSPSERARRHALWGLAAIEDARSRGDARDGGDMRERTAIRDALRHDGADTRMQAARALGDLGVREAAPDLARLLADEDAFVRRTAAASLERLRASDSAPELLDALRRCDDRFLEWTLQRALVSAGAWRDVASLLRNATREERARLWPIFHERYDVEALRALLSTCVDPLLCVEALPVLATCAKKREAWDGVWWKTQPAKLPAPSYSVEWDGTRLAAEALIDALRDDDQVVFDAALAALRRVRLESTDGALIEQLSSRAEPASRLAVLASIGELGVEAATPAIAELLRDREVEHEVRLAAIDALGSIRAPGSVTVLAGAAAARSLDPGELAGALAALAKLRAVDQIELVRSKLAHFDADVRAAALRALADLAGPAAAADATARLDDGDPRVARAAIEALGDIRASSATPALLARFDRALDRDLIVRALARMPEPAALDAFLWALVGEDAALADLAERSLTALRDAVRAELEGRAERGALAEDARLALQRVFAVPQPVLEWKLIGPFAKTLGDPGLEHAELDFAQPVSGAAGELSWTDATADAKHGLIDLRLRFGDGAAQWAYAATTVSSASARQAELRVGSDDQIGVWINGELVHAFDGDRAWSADQDRATVRLREGDNAILVRVGQTAGDWMFNVKLSPAGAGPLFARADAPADKVGEPVAAAPSPLDALRAAGLAGGDAERGKRLVDDASRTLCLRCHAIGGVGELVGPDLSDVGARYARDELVASLLEPSKRIAESYRAWTIVTRDEQVFFGALRGERDGALELVDARGELQRIPLDQIETRRESPISVMPDGLAEDLGVDEFADLVAYLASLRGAPSDKR